MLSYARMHYQIQEIAPRDAESLRDRLTEVYAAAFAAPPYFRTVGDAEQFGDSFARHVQRPGFRCYVARTRPAGPIAGFAYGYTNAPGQWWSDVVTRGLGPERVARWLAGAFELVELAVLPGAQGRGLGSRLHDTVLAGLPHRTAVLSTAQAETTALHLYRKRGWVVLLEHFYFPGVGIPYLVMGLDLPPQPASRQPAAHMDERIGRG